MDKKKLKVFKSMVENLGWRCFGLFTVSTRFKVKSLKVNFFKIKQIKIATSFCKFCILKIFMQMEMLAKILYKFLEIV